ncbi:Bromodomain adjacent to zinc finger domain protein 2B [Glycine soja]
MSSLSECCMENVDSSLTKERVPIIVPGEKSLADKENLNNGTAKVSIEICQKSEADTENNFDVAEDVDLKFSAHDGLHEKVEELVKSPGRAEPQSEDESDESDVVEHDVKVCDICGDAGREDLLAICSRCSDGAEHTYCMREMLEKVPEGDWLCEECKCAEETANQKLDIEEKKNHEVCSTSRISGKRPSQNMEIATAAKRQALGSSTGSPKASSPKRIVPLLRESSFKSMDKGKMKSGQQIPMCNHLGGNDTELARSLSTVPRGQNARGTLLKSNSFNNFNSKPRVKLVDEVIPQKQKGGVEHISKNMETPAGMISKSMSFKSSNLGRSIAVESKVKMMSSKPGTARDLKASRHTKDSASFDRKFLSKIDRPVICSTMVSSVVSTSKGDQKLTPHGETAKPSTVNNNREFKVNQDGKLYSSSKSINNTSSKSPEPQVSSDRTSTSVDETQQDRLPRSQDTANQVDKTKDSSSDHVTSGVTNASKSSFCRKCKDFGHATECCTVSGTQEFGAESSVIATSSSKDEMHEGNRLKAAIQAALLRRPEIHKRKEAPDQTNEFPTSSTGLKREVTSQKQVLVSSTLKNGISAEESNMKQEIIENSTFETSKCPSANDLKQLEFCRTDVCSQLRKSDSAGPTSGKPVVRDDFPNNAMEISSILSKMSVIPEYECIWQGVFVVHRNGMPPDLYTGIQAHLSACASPKVHEVVKKFLPEVSLNEVSRLSVWPSQFHQGGAKEDNIALYFFARDIESYERYYKGLLDHMIRNDLALRGTFDGVELLIFASNQLLEDSQRWNMLFFLWGIFRGRRINHLDSTKKICIPSLNVMPNEKDFPTAVMTLSETQCSPKHVDKESIDQGHNMVSRNFDGKETIFDQTHLGLQVNLERQDTRINTKSTLGIPTISTQICQEVNSTGSSLRDSVPKHRQYIKSKPPEAMGTSVSSRIVETKTNHDISVKQENSLSSGIHSVGCQEIDTASNISKDKILDRTNNGENQQRPKRKQMEDDLDINVEATFQRDLTVKAVNCQLPNDKKVKHIDLSDTVVEASAVSCQKIPWNEVNGKFEDRESYSRELRTSFGGIHGCYDSGAWESFNGSSASLVNDLGSCSLGEDKRCKEPCDEKIIHEDFGAMERTFFPVDTRKKNDLGMVLNSESLNEPREYVDQVQVGIPNLELGLGGETKPSHKGMLPFFVGAVHKKNNQEKIPEILTYEREDENVAASLSLSLSFPSSNKEHVKPVPKAEPLPGGHNVNSPYLLFRRFTDK